MLTGLLLLSVIVLAFIVIHFYTKLKQLEQRIKSVDESLQHLRQNGYQTDWIKESLVPLDKKNNAIKEQIPVVQEEAGRISTQPYEKIETEFQVEKAGDEFTSEVSEPIQVKPENQSLQAEVPDLGSMEVQDARTKTEWEMLIGGKWLNRIGAIALISWDWFLY
jgi:hypothetical protein